MPVGGPWSVEYAVMAMGDRRSWREWRWAVGACALLLVAYVVLAWSAVVGKSATYDEPLHLVAAHTVRHLHDFRVNPEDPPLWEYWADLPHGMEAIHPDYGGEVFKVLLKDPTYHWRFTLEALYPPAGLDADAYLRASRAMMIIVAVGLGVALGVVGWRMGGAWAACVAVGLFALDPNFLAHGALVKNDVMFSLAMFVLSAGLWSAGRRVTWWNVLVVAVACGVGLTTKFSGVLMAPMVAGVLAGRAVLPDGWRVGRRVVAGWRKWVVAVGLGVGVGLFSWGAVWGVYGFRFAATPAGGMIDTAVLAKYAARNKVAAEAEKKQKAGLLKGLLPDTEREAEIARAAAHPGLLVDFALWGERHRVLPQAWLAGLLYTYMSSLTRASFLLGEVRISGWWYYFPLAMLFKTPVGTIVAIVAAAGWWVKSKVKRHKSKAGGDAAWVWAVIAFGVPWGIYAIAAITTNLNIGLRHVLPLYPGMFLMAGVAAAEVAAARAWAGWLAAAGVGVALLAETVGAYPNFIPFFNAPSQAYGPYRLLGDSNLDWGQDLLLLKKWRDAHPGVPLYVCYFGSAPPGYYRIDGVPLPGGYQYGESVKEMPVEAGVLAMSVTDLQGIYMPTRLARMYQEKTNRMPVIGVLGGSIYLYAVPRGGLK